MSKLQHYVFQDHSVRLHIDEHGEPWWVAKDVCDVLGLGNSRQATARLDDDEKCVISNDAGVHIVTVINETGLYTLILGSRKPEAKSFKRWVTHEVLPSIRKTGQYVVDEHNDDDFAVMKNMVNTSVKMIRRLEQQAKDIMEIDHRVAKLSTRIDTLDALDVMPDGRQKLNKMVKKYAHDNGIAYPVAWGILKDTLNTTYHWNLTRRINEEKKRLRMKSMSLPKYLEINDMIPDAIRVMDKLLNRKGAA